MGRRLWRRRKTALSGWNRTFFFFAVWEIEIPHKSSSFLLFSVVVLFGIVRWRNIEMSVEGNERREGVFLDQVVISDMGG